MKKRTFKQIVDHIAEYVMIRDGLVKAPKRPVVATELDIPYFWLDNWLHRDSKFHETVLNYCIRENLDIKSVFYYE